MEAFNAILAQYPDPSAEKIEQWRRDGQIVAPVESYKEQLAEMKAQKAAAGFTNRLRAFLRLS